jgi:hypothetical protein
MPNIGNVTQQVVVTTPPGESLQSAFVKINDNFANVWAAGPVGSNVKIVDNSINTLNTNGGLVLNPNGIGNVVANAHVIPDQTRIRNLGAPSRYWYNLYTWYGTIQNATIGNATIGNAAISNPGNITIGVANLHITGGSNGYVLQTDGTGNLTWTAQSGGGGNGVPGGANTQIQFNNSGAFGGSPNFTYNTTTGNINLAGNIVSGNVYASSYYIGGTPLTRTLTVGRAASPVTIPLATNNSFNVLTGSGNVTVYTT